MNFEILVWIVPLLVAGLGVWKPYLGLVALAASLPLFGSPPGGPYLGALDAAAIAAILTSIRAVLINIFVPNTYVALECYIVRPSF